jgi:hypothetical protein
MKFFAASIAIAGCTTASSASPIPVEIQRGGDDGLTVRLADTLEAAFQEARGFAHGDEGQPATLVVVIPRNVQWADVGARTRVIFQVEFRRADSRLLARSRGTCWETQLETCAAHILSDARNAIRSSRLD